MLMRLIFALALCEIPTLVTAQRVIAAGPEPDGKPTRFQSLYRTVAIWPCNCNQPMLRKSLRA